MRPTHAIWNAIRHSSSGEIVGRKRLQKLIHLIQLGGEEVAASFRIHHYGPFSYEVADALSHLEREGYLTERYEPRGIFQTYQYVYSANPDRDLRGEEFQAPTHEKLWRLERYTTPILEGASTVGFFSREEHVARVEAYERARQVKPFLADPAVRKKVGEVLDLLGI